MIPLLIYMFMKKHGKKYKEKAGMFIKNFFSATFSLAHIGIIIILLSLIPKSSKSQIQEFNYYIMQGDNNIGWLRLESNINGNRSTLNLISEVKTSFILPIHICTKETSTFENGKLINSTQFRKNNTTIKLNKQTKYTGENYEVEKKGEKVSLNFPVIGTTLLSLYFKEPIGVDRLYCDNHECFIKIYKTDDGGYKVNFPDGNSNQFFYSGGICTKIKIEHTFYSATIVHSSKK